jgi:VWFA-related protein
VVLRASLLLSLLAAACFPQQQTIKTTVPLVVVPVSVADRGGRFVHGLTTSDFLLLDEGQPRSIRVDDADSVTAGLDLIALVQTTDLSNSALLKIKKVGTMIQDAVVGANGQAAVIVFADQVQLVQAFTSDAGEISNGFRNLRSEDTRKGRLVDAVSKALDLLASRPDTHRRAILIIGESKDRGSETKLENLLPSLQRSGVTIYSLNYSAYLTPFTTKGSDYSPPESGSWLDAITEAVHATTQDTCKILTGASGGRVLKFETKSRLENDLIRLGSDIHNRYMLSFTPAESRPGGPAFHKIAVEIRNRPELRVQARPGYWVDLETR